MTLGFLADHPECRDILSKWIAREWPELFTADFTPDHELAACLHRDKLDCTLLGFVEDKLTASASLLAEDVLPLPQFSPWLGTVVVNPSQRGGGFGRSIVLAAMDHARFLGIPTLHLWTPHHRGFYEKLGWQFVCDYPHEARAVSILRFQFPQNPV